MSASDVDLVILLDISLNDFLNNFELLKNEIFVLLQISVVADSCTMGKSSIVCKWNDNFSCDICIAPALAPEGNTLWFFCK